jgi:hypothetical protein
MPGAGAVTDAQPWNICSAYKTNERFNPYDPGDVFINVSGATQRSSSEDVCQGYVSNTYTAVMPCHMEFMESADALIQHDISSGDDHYHH